MKRKVLSWTLKEERLEQSWRGWGGEFQSLGAAALKDLPPTIERLLHGTARSPVPEDLREREGQYRWRSSLRCVRARPWRALKVRRRSLCLEREDIGNQWSWWRMGVMCAELLVKVRTQRGGYRWHCYASRDLLLLLFFAVFCMWSRMSWYQTCSEEVVGCRTPSWYLALT